MIYVGIAFAVFAALLKFTGVGVDNAAVIVAIGALLVGLLLGDRL